MTAGWPRHAGALAVAVAAILAIFHVDATRLVGTWWTSTTYGHCLFVGPVIGWLVWIRRTEVGRIAPSSWWPGLCLAGGGGVIWLLGEAGTVTFARQIGLVVMVQGAVVTILGPHVARALLFPLAYALFLVPFGEELEPLLQDLTVAQVMPLLALAGIPATVDGVLIHAGRYLFEVAEACSGAKFVIAMIAFGTLVAHVGFVSLRRRACFMAAALLLPVLANGLRAFATIYVADRTSIETATGFDHIVYGWVFFGVVMALLIGAAWRWFDRAPTAAMIDPAAFHAPRSGRMGPIAAGMLVIASAALFPGWASGMHRADTLPPRIALPDLPGWTRQPLSIDAAWQPWHPGADHYLFGRYADRAGDRVDVAIAVYARQREGAKLGAFGTGVLRADDRWLRVADLPPVAGGTTMRIVAPGPVERVVASWYGVGDVITGDPRRVKIETMRGRLFGGRQRAVAIHLSTEGRSTRPIERLLAALGPLATLADRGDDPRGPAIEQVGP
jgi:exosortase A